MRRLLPAQVTPERLGWASLDELSSRQVSSDGQKFGQKLRWTSVGSTAWVQGVGHLAESTG
jgi:hypothetical protein